MEDANGKEPAHVHLGSPLRFAGFTDGGKRLVLLGSDQVVREVPLNQSVPLMTVASAQ